MSGTVPPLPQYAFMVWRSVKAQGQIYLYYYYYYYYYYYLNLNLLESGKLVDREDGRYMLRYVLQKPVVWVGNR